MESIIEYIQSNAHHAPYTIFGLMLLAGFNIPVSEDLMLFISGVLASENPELRTSLFLGIFGGVYVSDLISYGFMGRYLGTRLFQIKFFARIVSQKKIDKASDLYEKYGLWMLLIGRFIPFGVRNGLFMAAGICKLNAVKFVLIDFVAAFLTTTVYFYIYYTYGEVALSYIKSGSTTLLAAVVLLVVGFLIVRRFRR